MEPSILFRESLLVTSEPGMVVHGCNLGILEARTGDSETLSLKVKMGACEVD